MNQTGALPITRKPPGELLKAQGKLNPEVVAVRADGELRDLHTPVAETAVLEPINLREPGGARDHPPLDGARDGGRRAAPVPGHEGDDRPRDRERLLLRLRSPGRAVHRGGPRAHRGGDARDHRGRLPVPARGHREGATRASCSRTWARPTRSSSSSGSEGEISLYRHGRVGRPVRGAARAVDRLSARGEADHRRRRLLARRRAQPDAAAHLRHGVPDREGARRAPRSASKRPRSATTASSARSSSCSGSTSRAGDAVLPAARRRRLQPARSTTCAISTSARLRRGDHAAGLRPRAVRDLGPPAELRANMFMATTSDGHRARRGAAGQTAEQRPRRSSRSGSMRRCATASSR